jgi:hypothetical protein
LTPAAADSYLLSKVTPRRTAGINQPPQKASTSNLRTPMPAPHYDYRATLAAWPQPRPANDNLPLKADSFTDLAARRAYVQRAQREPDPMLALPTLERLGRVAPDAVPMWKFWRDLQAAPAADVLVESENFVDEDEDRANSGFSGGEQDLEIRPTVDELQRAIESAGSVSVVCIVRYEKRSDVRCMSRLLSLGNTTKVGDLVFREGHLTRWGVTSRGVSLKPTERLRAEKGSRQAPSARDLRHLVQTDAPMARVVEFHAGVTHSTGRSGAPPECFAEREQSRKAKEIELRQALGAHAEILDLAIGDASAREIGERRGYQGKHAERRGIHLVHEAFAALRALVGENNFKVAA